MKNEKNFKTKTIINNQNQFEQNRFSNLFNKIGQLTQIHCIHILTTKNKKINKKKNKKKKTKYLMAKK